MPEKESQQLEPMKNQLLEAIRKFEVAEAKRQPDKKEADVGDRQ